MLADFPYKKSFIILVACLFLSVLGNGFKNLDVLIMFIASIIVPSLVIWFYCRNETYNNLIKTLKHVFFVAGVYGLFTFFFDVNPYLDYLRTAYADNPVNFIFDYSNNEVRGNRLQSFFNHPIRFGGFIAIVMPLMLVIPIANVPISNRDKIGYYLSFFFLLLCLILVNSRSPLILFIVAISFLFFNFKKKWLYLFSILVFVAPLFFLFINESSEYFQTIGSLFNLIQGDSESKMGGSSIEMRFIQLAAVQEIFATSPFFGGGLGYTNQLVLDATVEDLYGAESFLFSVMIDTGICGVLGYSLFFIYIINTLVKRRGMFKEIMILKYLYSSLIGTVIGYLLFILITGELDTLRFFLIYLVAITAFADEISRRGIIE